MTGVMVMSVGTEVNSLKPAKRNLFVMKLLVFEVCKQFHKSKDLFWQYLVRAEISNVWNFTD